MTGTRKFVVVLAGVALVTGACGGDTESGDPAVAEQTTSTGSGSVASATIETTQVEEPEAEEQGTEDANEDTSNLSGEGTFSVDGERSETEWVVRCAPSDEFGGNPDERDLELVAYSDEGGFLTLDVGVEDLEGMGENNYTYNTFGLDWGRSVQEVEIYGFTTSPDGDWYFGVDPIQLALGAQTIDPLDPPPASIDGDRISGSIDIAAIDPAQPDGATIAFDLSIPPERFDCSQL